MSEILKQDDITTIIRDGSYVVKKYNNLSKKENKILRQKLERSETLSSIEGLVTPLSFSLNGGKVEEIYFNFVEGINFADFLNENGLNVSLSIVTDYILSLEALVKKGHEYNVVFPDLLTGGNVLYDVNNKKIYALDYDGLQIEDLPSFGISDFICKPHNTSLLHSQKYYRNGLYTKNLDLYSIYVAYLYYTTKLNAPRDPRLKETLSGYLKSANILQTEAAQKILDIYNLSKDNRYLDDDLRKIEEKYYLSENVPGCMKTFIRK